MPFAYSNPQLAKTGTYLDNKDDRAPGPGAYNTAISTLIEPKTVMHIRPKDLV